MSKKEVWPHKTSTCILEWLLTLRLHNQPHQSTPDYIDELVGYIMYGHTSGNYFMHSKHIPLGSLNAVTSSVAVGLCLNWSL